MTDPSTTEEIMVHLQYLRAGVDQINARLDVQNGRLRVSETDIAILKDRQSDARKTGGVYGAAAGTFVGGLLIALYQYFSGGTK